MPEETLPNNSQTNSWFSDMNLKTAVLVAALSSVFGIGGGVGLVASKGVEAAGGMTSDQADVRYLKIDEADRRAAFREKQIEDAKRELKSEIEKTLKKESFDIWIRTWEERQKRFDDKLDKIAEK